MAKIKLSLDPEYWRLPGTELTDSEAEMVAHELASKLQEFVDSTYEVDALENDLEVVFASGEDEHAPDCDYDCVVCSARDWVGANWIDALLEALSPDETPELFAITEILEHVSDCGLSWEDAGQAMSLKIELCDCGRHVVLYDEVQEVTGNAVELAKTLSDRSTDLVVDDPSSFWNVFEDTTTPCSAPVGEVANG